MLNSILSLSWIPFVTMLIGWVTNWLAIKMLFRPQSPLKIPGLQLQGLIPKRQQELAEKIGEIVEKELISAHTIRSKFESIDLDPHLEKLSQKLVRERLAEKLRTIPLIGNMVNDSTLQLLEKITTESLQREVTPLKTTLAEQLEANLDIKAVVYQRIVDLELERLEKLVNTVARKEFKSIEYLGGALGFIIGLVQIIILAG